MNLYVKISWLGSEEMLYLMTLSVTSLYSTDVGCMRNEYEALEW
jgi:hypothetical protein